MKLGTYELDRYGYTTILPAISNEIYGANIIQVAAGTNGLHGGDSGHGSQSFFEIIDQGGTDINVCVNGKEIINVERVTITVGGDSELWTLIEALAFGAKTLRAFLKSSILRKLALKTDLEMTPEEFTQLIAQAKALDEEVGMNEIAIIDADLIGRKNHRFPNLTCMKISGYYKSYGWFVTLKTDWDGLDNFHRVYIAKVFTDKPIPDGGLFGDILKRPNVIYGGTGFFFDEAEPLPDRIEHVMPDYHLYDKWLGEVDDGSTKFKSYRDYSIGFLTRGCFRHCPFCVNRRSSKVVAHSPLAEFLDPTRKKICLLDDNFFGYDGWKDLLLQLQATGKPFVFKQGLDVRLLDDEKARLLFKSHYDGDFIFAFDDVNDAPLIEEKLQLIRRYTCRRVKFYVLCGFDRAGKYDDDFWERDLQSVLDRAELLKRYDCLAYVMRHENYRASPHRKLYNRLTDWANQPHMFLKKTFAEYVGYEAQYRKQRRKKHGTTDCRQD